MNDPKPYIALLALFLTACPADETNNGDPDAGTNNVDPDAGMMATCDDGEQNGQESDVDCGGPDCSVCRAGQACSIGADCAIGRCVDSTCVGASCEDGVRNGDETDVDCGGDCDPCEDGSACLADSDCASENCIDDLCATPTCGDGIVNQTDEVCDDGEELNGPDTNCSADCSQRLCTLGEDVDTLQEAADDESCLGVWLPQGEYDETVTLDRPFRIVGETPDTVLRTTASETIITTTADYLEVSSLTITGGEGETGGGISAVRDEGSEPGVLLLEGVTIKENTASIRGGGVAAIGYDVEVFDSTFLSNLARSTPGETARGGGLFVERGSLSMVGGRFEDNEASVVEGAVAAALGGGLAALDADVDLEETDFVDNRSITTTDEAMGGSIAFGGAIGAGLGSLTISGGELSGNEARATSALPSTTTQAGGAGLYLGEADATITDLVVQNNALVCDSASSVQCRGAGLTIYNKTAELTGVQISNNTIDVTGETHKDNDFVVGGGAGMAMFGDGTTRVTDSTISGNTVTADMTTDGLVWGGGILVSGVSAVAAVYVDRCTIDDNHVSIDAGSLSLAAGGGVGVDAQRFETEAFIVNSTLSGNSAMVLSGGTQLGTGGGVAVDKAASLSSSGLLIRSSTIVGNEATTHGGGVSTGASGAGTDATIANSIIIDNVAPTHADCEGDVLTSLGFNLLHSDADCERVGSTVADVLDPTATVGPLQDNGGPTLTHAIEATSPAVDAGDPAGCADNAGTLLLTDQRGMARDDGACDIGSFEVQ